MSSSLSDLDTEALFQCPIKALGKSVWGSIYSAQDLDTINLASLVLRRTEAELWIPWVPLTSRVEVHTHATTCQPVPSPLPRVLISCRLPCLLRA